MDKQEAKKRLFNFATELIRLQKEHHVSLVTDNAKVTFLLDGDDHYKVDWPTYIVFHREFEDVMD